MTVTVIGRLAQVESQFEYHDPARRLRSRGGHPEWVLQAAAEVVTMIEKAEAERALAEAQARHKAGEVPMITVDAAEMDWKERFDHVAQCAITLGRIDYKWIDLAEGALGLNDFVQPALRRIQDISLTRSGSFLQNEPGMKMPRLDD